MQSQFSIIPFPNKIKHKESNFSLNSETVILYDENTQNLGKYLQSEIENTITLKLTAKEFSNYNQDTELENCISLSLQHNMEIHKSKYNDSENKNSENKNSENKNSENKNSENKNSENNNNKFQNNEFNENESYIVEINENQINCISSNERGIFYCIQTLIQIINQFKNVIPSVRIEDYPKFQYRGFMLDVGRHFFGIDVIKKIIDVLSLLKLNVFHWHLSEDQGWRIEIKKYPKLTEIGSKRKSSQIGGFVSKKEDNIPHQGFYTQEDIRSIVKYAKEKYITIIPEIDLPGHTTALLAAYPEYSCTGGPFEVATHYGIKKDVLCVGKEKTFEFIQDILDELIELFPSSIIHIGGDEVPKDRWKNCPDCQKRIKDENLEDEHQLQVYFTNRIIKYLKEKGKRTMGWNEILSKDLDISAIGQYWARGKDKVLDHLRRGGNIVMSKFGWVYLDYNYGLTPLRKTYRYQIIPDKLEQGYVDNILGIEAPMWTEWVPNEGRLYWQTFPRLIAVAENGWTEENNKNYSDFLIRLPNVLDLMKVKGVGSAKLSEVDPKWFKRLKKMIFAFTASNEEAEY